MRIFEWFAVFPKECEKTFLGLKPPYHYLTPKEGTCDVGKFNFLGPDSDIPLIFLAIIDDLLRIAGIIAVVFVIMGAVGFINSDGSPEKAAKARETILAALIGLALVMISVAFVGYLGNRLGGA